MATQCNPYRALLVCFCLVSVLLIISDRVVFHLYIHIADTSKEAEGLTVVSRKTRCFYELLSSVVRHAEKHYVTSQILTPAKTHLLLPTIRGTQKLIRQKSSGTLKDQSFKMQALFATFFQHAGKFASVTYLPWFPNGVKANISVYQKS